jgi:two-component system CheB/CheR fusion protein
MSPKISGIRKKQNKTETHKTPLDKAQKSPQKPERPGAFPIVGIGASAGGLEAVTSFLSKVPVDSGMAFILVQHLDPSQPSRLTELLGKASPIPVQEAVEGTRVEPDHVYVIPPGSDMTIRDHKLRLEAKPEHPGLLHSIDVFFRSLAEDAEERAIAIILSGTASDGTNGAGVVKAGQGLVIVQDPESAKYDGMPRAAIAAGVADYILKPEAMAGQLMEYIHKSYKQQEETRNAQEKDDFSLTKILTLVHARTGRDFSGYKISSITRRIEHRMAANQIESSSNYLRFLQENPLEIKELVQDFLINVTSFFRDKEAFNALKKEIIKILKDKPEGGAIRAWIPGCSTGEEAYSLAMILVECAEMVKRYYDIQVFGTDLDTNTITAARAGIYPATIARDVSKKRLGRFFNRIDASYQVKKDLRGKAVFAVHDLVTDPPYSRMDIVSVRNLLIYFGADLQKKIIPLLHYSLSEGGILFLGTAETVGEAPEYFTPVDSKWRIYRSINKQKGQNITFTGKPVTLKSEETHLLPAAKPPPAPDELLLEALPPSVIVNRNYQLIYVHGNTNKYLQLPEGNPSNDILAMANPDLRMALANALHEVSHGKKEIICENLPVQNYGQTQSVKIKVRLLSKMDGRIVVTFEDIPFMKHRKVKGETLSEVRHSELEQELQHTKVTLQDTIEELETANEELRSTNEEYMSANEELKSTNEELETSREELRSVNEELTTINTEREEKINELTAVSDDMRNLLNSTGVATVFLDEKLSIRRFTPAATVLFKFIDSDVGRSVEDITSHLKADGLPQAARRVLETLIPSEQEVQTKNGHWYSMKIHPYRTADNAIEGVVAYFEDIDKMKTALGYAEGIIGTVREPLLVLDENLRIISASQSFYTTFGVNKKDTERQTIYDLGDRQWDIPQLRALLRSILKENKVFEGFRVEHHFPGLGRRIMLLNARRIHDGTGTTQNILLAIEDITDRPGLEAFSAGKARRKTGSLGSEDNSKSSAVRRKKG